MSSLCGVRVDIGPPLSFFFDWGYFVGFLLTREIDEGWEKGNIEEEGMDSMATKCVTIVFSHQNSEIIPFSLPLISL